MPSIDFRYKILDLGLKSTSWCS